MAIDKPAGLLSVPIPGMKSANLQQLVQADYGSKVKPVHRIDRYTTGIVLFARNRRMHSLMVKQFRERKPVRSYLALIRGVPKENEQTLTHYLKRVQKGFRNIVVKDGSDGGSFARLSYTVKERFAKAALIEVSLDTGLKNQIRVQLNASGHPLVGDRHYKAEEANEPLIDRQALHAVRLSIVHPLHGKTISFESPVPKDMQRLMRHFRGKI